MTKITINNRLIYLLLIGVTLLLFSCNSKTVIKANQAGVIFNNRTGKIEDKVLFAGEYEKELFKTIYVIDIQKKQVQILTDYLCLDGFHDSVFFSLDYSPNIDSLPSIYSKFRDQYLYGFIVPMTRSYVRDVFRKYKSDEIDKSEISEEIFAKLTENSSYENLFQIDGYIIRDWAFYEDYKKAKSIGLENDFIDLNSDKRELRIEALKKLVKNKHKEITLPIILNHWCKENDKEIKEMIINQLK